jgi:polar amino acid transport system substrate-binding protein
MKKLILVLCFVLIAFSARAETAWERVEKTRTLRCGYIILPPEFVKDVNTGKFSGVAYDVTNEIAKRLGLKVEWTEEVTFPTMAEGLKAGRYDALCFTLYRNTQRALVMDFTMPLFATPTLTFARHGDTRFDHNLAAIDNASVTIATVDGEMSSIIAKDQFPKAKTHSLPQTTPLSDMLLSVASGKADVTFINAAAAMPYLEKNPDTLHLVALDRPVNLYSHGLAMGLGEHTLKSALNVALAEMIDQGELDRILDQYEKAPGALYRLNPTFQVDAFALPKVKAKPAKN